MTLTADVGYTLLSKCGRAVAETEARGVPTPVDEVPSTEAELPRPEVVIGFACMKSFVVLAEGVHTCRCVWLASVASVPVVDFLAPAEAESRCFPPPEL